MVARTVVGPRLRAHYRGHGSTLSGPEVLP
jgi:hypothetical protein